MAYTEDGAVSPPGAVYLLVNKLEKTYLVMCDMLQLCYVTSHYLEATIEKSTYQTLGVTVSF